MNQYEIARRQIKELGNIQTLGGRRAFLEGAIDGIVRSIGGAGIFEDAQRQANHSAEYIIGGNAGYAVTKPTDGSSPFDVLDHTNLLENLKALKAKEGDKFVTTLDPKGKVWELRRYQSHSSMGCLPEFKFYLRGEEGETICSRAMPFIIMPLKRKPRVIKTYKWAVKFTDDIAPFVTPAYYPDEGQLRTVYAKRAIEWVQRLDKCTNEVEIGCDC